MSVQTDTPARVDVALADTDQGARRDGKRPRALSPLLAVCGVCGGAGTSTLSYHIARFAAAFDEVFKKSRLPKGVEQGSLPRADAFGHGFGSKL